MESPATQVLLEPPDKFYSAVFEASSSAPAVLADQYDHFVTLHSLMIRCTLIRPSSYWPASWPPISRVNPCFANSNEIALRNSCHEMANVFAIAHHGRLLRYLLHVSTTTCATLYRIINFLINTKLIG